MQTAWLRKILRANLTISKNTVVCIKPLKKSDVIKEDVIPEDDSPDVIIPRKHLKLKHIAISRVFSNLPLYFSELTSAAEPRQSLSKRRKKSKSGIDENKILSLDDFCIGIERRNQGFKTLVPLDKRVNFVLLNKLALDDDFPCP